MWRGWSEEDLQRLLQRQPGQPASLHEPIVRGAKKMSANNANKFRAQEQWIDGIRFPSKLEARHYVQLKLLKQAGDIHHFHRQVPFDLGGGVRHFVDWLVIVTMDIGFRFIYADSKGFDIPKGRDKRKLVKDRFDVDIVLWTKDVELP